MFGKGDMSHMFGKGNSKGGSNLSSRVANSNPKAGGGRYEDTAQKAQNAQLKADIASRNSANNDDCNYWQG